MEFREFLNSLLQWSWAYHVPILCCSPMINTVFHVVHHGILSVLDVIVRPIGFMAYVYQVLVDDGVLHGTSYNLGTFHGECIGLHHRCTAWDNWNPARVSPYMSSCHEQTRPHYSTPRAWDWYFIGHSCQLPGCPGIDTCVIGCGSQLLTYYVPCWCELSDTRASTNILSGLRMERIVYCAMI